MRIFLGLIGFVLTVVIIAALAVSMASLQMKQPSPLDKEAFVLIKPGTSVRSIAKQLRDQGAIDSQAYYLFPYVVRIRGDGGTFKAGEYLITPEMSANEIMTAMINGDIVQRQVTVPEGYTSKEAVDIINELKYIDGPLIENIPPEGSLLPESFAYNRYDTRQDILDRMMNDMDNLLMREWENRAENLPFDTKEEAVILASIIEKETGVAAEREMVAGVFVNRLRMGMPLQTDPTVIYAITEGKSKLDRPLYTRDLKRDHPYNTYMNAGLPPGPIANPGKASILAALNPAEHDYIYFVADGSGGHAFGKTLDEHNANVRKWREIQKKRTP